MAEKGRVKIRRTWRIKPHTRVKESGKRYRRPKAKRRTKKLINREAVNNET